MIKIVKVPIAMGAVRRGAAGILFIYPDRRLVFLIQRSNQVSSPGVWSIPGGGIEAGETPLQAAYRETTEEVGSVPSHRIRDQVTRGSYTTFIADVAAAVVEQFQPKLNSECSDAAWFGPNHLPSPMHESVKRIVKRTL